MPRMVSSDTETTAKRTVFQTAFHQAGSTSSAAIDGGPARQRQDGEIVVEADPLAAVEVGQRGVGEAK